MKNFIGVLAFILVVVGALNWLLVGAFDFNLVSFLFGAASALSNIIYIAVGVGGLYLIAMAIVKMCMPQEVKHAK